MCLAIKTHLNFERLFPKLTGKLEVQGCTKLTLRVLDQSVCNHWFRIHNHVLYTS